MNPRRVSSLLALTFAVGATVTATASPSRRVGRGHREDRAGWIYVHIEGAPREIGYQHGSLLAPEIDDAIRMMRLFVKKTTAKDWAFYRQTAQRLFWPKVGLEYREEIDGIVAGLRSRGYRYDRADVTALNGWIDVAWYYIPDLEAKRKVVMQHKPKEMCSAFIATGSMTKGGKIVMAHNAWVDYIIGERWRVIADVKPARGHRMLMDTFPGFIHSGDDFVQTDAGILITETTIAGFHGFNEKGAPEFVRARKAAQYAGSIDDFVRIMTTDNNGGYANDWLVGDTKTNEIARLELGLKNHRVWRTNDGILYGANYPCDDKTMKEETEFNAFDMQNSSVGRKMRWERLGDLNKGKIDAEMGRKFLADHYDQSNMEANPCCRTLCGHFETDPQGIPEAGWGPYYPTGAVQGKVTTAALAAMRQMWAHMGHPCGQDFLVRPLLKAHPEYRWQARFLRDMKAGPWTLFKAD